MQISGWGRFPVADAQVITPLSSAHLLDSLAADASTTLIARGLGRSYGDSSLAPRVLCMGHMNHCLAFDEESGLLRCGAGLSMAEILRIFVPKGWFPPVTPGTKFVTVGGAVASDVHGKNHHLDGSFTDHVRALKVATISDGIVECSREQRPELFHATCGGMGLTGVVLEAAFTLKPIPSARIKQITIRARHLAESMALFEEHHQSLYSAAWIDCLSTGRTLGRSLLVLGEHAPDGALTVGRRRQLSIPVNMPGVLLHPWLVQAFNTLYYHRVMRRRAIRTVHYEPFFYPLDGVYQWNRMYGKNGFLQYQFVLPKEAGLEGVSAVLQRIAASKRGSFLAVLKAFGKGNDNYLSFPMEGYTLALDFKIDKELFALLDELDSMILDYGGRLYLSKDARMSEAMFKRSYPRWEEFMKVRIQYDAQRSYHSLQSKRLGL